MKPRVLRLQAFGPYAQTAEIDFRALAGGGLFLIHGQTGAGKTSILDGLCFALFGTSSGADRSGEGLRSDLADQTLPTEVALEFSLGQRIYRVTRRPRQQLKKQRGDGMTTSQPKGELFELMGDPEDPQTWRPIASGDKKTDERIVELLGMDENQFRQVVVLPQGQFRKFLSATSEKREELLEALFRTEKYRRLSELLQARSQASAGLVNEKRQAMNAQLASAEAQNSEELEARLSSLATEVETAETALHELESRATEAGDRLQQARTLERARQELEQVKHTTGELSLRKAEIDEISQRLAQDRRSRPVLMVDAATASAQRDFERLESSQQIESERRLQAESELTTAHSHLQDLLTRQNEIETMRGEKQRLGEIWTTAKRLQSEQTAHFQREKDHQAALENFRSLEGRAQTVRMSRPNLLDDLAKIAELAVSSAPLIAEHKQKAAQIEALDDELQTFASLQDQIEKLRTAHEGARAASEARNTRLTELRIRFHLSQATLLARELTSGSPCPVCGSRDHPRPASSATPAPGTDEDDVNAAELEVRRSSENAARLQAQVESAEAELIRCQQRLQKLLGSGPEDEGMIPERAHAVRHRLRKDQDELASAIARSEAAAKEKTALENRLRELDLELQRLESSLATANAEREKRSTALEAGRVIVQELLALVPEEMRDLASIAHRGRELKTAIEAHTADLEKWTGEVEQRKTQLAASAASLATLQAQGAEKSSLLEKLSAERDQALRESGFPNLEACRAAALAPRDAEELETSVRAHFDRVAINESRHKELQIQLQNPPPWAVDVAACEREFGALDLARREKRDQTAALREKRRLLEQIHARLQSLTEETRLLEEAHGAIGRLAAIAGGQPPFNLARVNFSRFVLASRLDDVLALASRRLFIMSRGQFTLRRATTQEDKRRSAGLDLEVEDAYSGTARATSSLSGGEGFMASLCLALGLADVVQCELGGVRLEAVFVDEGFGTLDPEALDLAMQALNELQAGGRMVGIISHVPELKDQVARRLSVRKSPKGSQVSWENAQPLNKNSRNL